MVFAGVVADNFTHETRLTQTRATARLAKRRRRQVKRRFRAIVDLMDGSG